MELIKMKNFHQQSDQVMRVLYEASHKGCVPTLNSLIHQHPQILYKISQTSFTETPLHISALLGHADFTKALLSHNPKLALELDSSRSTALHVASAEGHVDIVKELVKANSEACLAFDEEGRIPLHYAVMRGRIEVVRVLIKAKPETIGVVDNGRKTVYHLCVAYNHLETLKAIVELELDMTGQLLNFIGSDGAYTILHLAIMLNRVEIIRYLLSISEIREAASMKNEMGQAVHEILEQSPIKDLKTLEIQLMLMKAGIFKTENKDNMECKIDDHPNLELAKPQNHNFCTKIFIKSIGNWFKYNKNDWLQEMRGNMSLVATMISTISFQAIISPPGGFIQQGLSPPVTLATITPPPISDESNDLQQVATILSCTTIDGAIVCPGQALSSYNNPRAFLIYLICNTISFISSLCVVLLLVSGFPMKNRIVMWVLSIGMCIALSSLAIAYFVAVGLVIPDQLWKPFVYMIGYSFEVWIILLGLIGMIIIIRFLVWVVKKCVGTFRVMMSKRSRKEKRCSCCC